MKLNTIAIVIGGLLCTTPAHAQIYSWRDSNGHLVLSDRPLVPGAKSFPVPTSPSIRTTRPLASGARSSYDELIERHAAAHQVRPDLVRAVIQVESAFNARALSPKGAMGLMQLMPATAAELGVRNPYDPAENIRGGVAYLRQLLDRYKNSVELALAAYNAGPGAVDQHGVSVPPYRETRDYVRRIKDMTALTDVAVRRRIYKTLEIVNGRPIPRYSDTKPASGEYEVMTLAR